jgi:lysophospholipase L1-like esterase
MKVRLLLIGGLAAMAAVAGPPALAAKPVPPGPRYYLALGDSLSVGYQPNANGTGVETDRGYANDLFALEARRIKKLQLVKMGCPGDTTTSLLTGVGNSSSAQQFRCNRKGGSQLKAAVSFLKKHHRAGQVPLVTIDIGANDILPCVSAGSLSTIIACVTSAENSIKTNTPKILSALKAAAPKRTTFVAMNLYDPVLSDYFSANPTDKTLASASVPLLQGINGDIQSANAAAGFKTADVANAFNSYNQSPTVSFAGQKIPVNVAYVCGWTWACTTPPVGPNIHANDNGYSVIARVFYTTVGRLK